MLKAKLCLFIGIGVLVCCAGQQCAACVTLGLDEFVASGCGNSSCTVQTCGNGGGGGGYIPLQNQLLIPNYHPSEFVVAAKMLSPSVYSHSSSVEAISVSSYLTGVDSKVFRQKTIVAMARGEQ